MTTTKKPLKRGMRPVHPGAILREEVLPALKISVSAAAEKLGVSRQTLHRILSESAPITPEMAVRIGKLCGNGPDLWARMQSTHDVWRAQAALADEIAKIPTMKAA